MTMTVASEDHIVVFPQGQASNAPSVDRGAVPASIAEDQLYYWTARWQREEQETLEELARGDVSRGYTCTACTGPPKCGKRTSIAATESRSTTTRAAPSSFAIIATTTFSANRRDVWGSHQRVASGAGSGGASA